MRLDEVFGLLVGWGATGDEVDVGDCGERQEGVDDVGALNVGR